MNGDKRLARGADRRLSKGTDLFCDVVKWSARSRLLEGVKRWRAGREKTIIIGERVSQDANKWRRGARGRWGYDRDRAETNISEDRCATKQRGRG